MTWQILVFISIFAYAIANILQKVLLKDKDVDPIAQSAVFQLFVGIIIGIVGLLRGGLNFTFSDSLLPFLGLSFLLYTLGGIFLFKGLQVIDASKYTVIFTLRALVTIVAAAIFLHQYLNAIQLIGSLLIVASCILVSLDGEKKLKFNFNRGEIFVLAGAICFGLANANDSYILQSYELYSYLTLAFIVPAIFTLMISPKSINKLPYFFNLKIILKNLLLGAVYAVSSITFFGALQTSDNTAQVSSINLLSTVLVVILAVIFLNERKQVLLKVSGAVLSVIGLFLLTQWQMVADFVAQYIK